MGLVVEAEHDLVACERMHVADHEARCGGQVAQTMVVVQQLVSEGAELCLVEIRVHGDCGGESVEQAIERLGLKQNNDESALAAIVDQLFADNPDKVEALKKNPRMMGFFVGGVMRATGGKANPKLVNELVRARL